MGHKYKMGEQWLESSPAGRDTGVLADSRLSVSLHPALEAKRLHPGLHQTQHSQLVKRGDYPALFNVSAASLCILCAVLGPA